MTTKILALVDALGNLVRFALMPGQRGEITGAEKLIEGLSLGALLADKAYDADHFRNLLKSKGVEAVIPARKGRLNQATHDAEMYEGLSKVAFLLRKHKGPISSSDRMLDSAEFWNMRLQTESLVDDVMRTWPATIPVFLRYRMKCVGCPIGLFHTIHDACREHKADAVSFFSDLCAAAGQKAAANSIAGIHVSEDSANR